MFFLKQIVVSEVDLTQNYDNYSALLHVEKFNEIKKFLKEINTNCSNDVNDNNFLSIHLISAAISFFREINLNYSME